MENVDRCVCCGEIIPEGRQICPICEYWGQEKVKQKLQAKSPEPKPDRWFNLLKSIFGKGDS
jgi:uncharacterized Zn finger protein (UPF0148 family)